MAKHTAKAWKYKKYGKKAKKHLGLRGADFNPARAWQEFEERMAEAYARGQINDDIQRAVGRLGDALYDLREINGHADSCDEIPDRVDHVKRQWNIVKAALTPAEAALASKVVASATGEARATCAHPRKESLPPTRQRGYYPAAPLRPATCGIVCKIKKFFS